MEDDFKNNKINRPNIKISVIQSELFDESKNNLPYTLFIQLDNLPEKKIKTINNRIQTFEPPINEYIFELDIKENEIKEGNIKHILNFNAYITSLFFIQKKLASIRIPIFINKKISGKQWYILKDNKDKTCIKLLINIEINLPNKFYNNVNQNIYFNNSTKDFLDIKKNNELINSKQTTNKNFSNNINMNHNSKSSNCYTQLSTNFHSVYSNSLIKMNNQNNNTHNTILNNNKSTPIIFNNNNNLSNNCSNISYIVVNKEKDKNFESNTFCNNENFFSEYEMGQDENNNNLEEQLNDIKNMINFKKIEIEKKKEKIKFQKNELLNFEKKYFKKKEKFKNDLLKIKNNEVKLEKEKEIYENKNFDLNDELNQQNMKIQRNILIKDISTYENNILNNINNLSLNNHFDNLLLDSKMNNLFIRINNKYNNNKSINYKIKSKSGMNLAQYISQIKYKKGKNNLKDSNTNDKFSKRNTSDNISFNKSKNKKYSKNKMIVKKNTIFKANTNKLNIKKITKRSLFNKNEIKSARVHNYSSNKIRLTKNNNIFNENKLTTIKTFKNNRNNKTNLSFLFKTSFNTSLSKKLINSNKSLNLQKNNSITTFDNSRKNKISKIYYSNTNKIDNKRINNYPIKLKYINYENSFDNNKICPTEPSIPIKYKGAMNLNKKNKNINRSINCFDRNNNQNKIHKIITIEEKRKKLFKESKRKNKI